MASSSNFATWNAVTKASRVNLTISNCLAQGNTGADVGISSSIGVTSGKWYIEMRVNVNGNYPYVGLNADSTETAFASDAGQVLALRYSAGGGSVDDNTGSTTVDNWGTVTVTTTGVSAASDGDVIGIGASRYKNKPIKSIISFDDVDEVITETMDKTKLIFTEEFPILQETKFKDKHIINFLEMFPIQANEMVTQSLIANKPISFWDLFNVGTNVLSHHMNRDRLATHNIEGRLYPAIKKWAKKEAGLAIA